MKKLLAAALFALCLASPIAHAGWATGGVFSPPNDGDIIADTGAVGVAVTGFTVVLWTEGYDATFEIVLRNTLNTADVSKQLVRASYWTPTIYQLQTTAAIGQRIIVRTVGYPSGGFQASIMW